MARPTKLTPEVQDKVVQAVRTGNYAESAARLAGIGSSTYYRWMERGSEEPSGPYRDFHEAVRRAEAEAEVHAVAIVRRAMAGDWRAALGLSGAPPSGALAPPPGDRADRQRWRSDSHRARAGA